MSLDKLDIHGHQEMVLSEKERLIVAAIDELHVSEEQFVTFLSVLEDFYIKPLLASTSASSSFLRHLMKVMGVKAI